MKILINGTALLLFFALVLAVIFGFGWVTSTLWEQALVPQGLKSLTAWQGACLNALGGMVCKAGTTDWVRVLRRKNKVIS